MNVETVAVELVDPPVNWAEPLIPRREIPAAVRRLTRGGKRPCEGTVRRWYRKGIGGVQLEVVNVGGAVFTTESRLKVFFARTTAAKQRRRSPTRHVSEQSRHRSYAEVEAELEAMGI